MIDSEKAIRALLEQWAECYQQPINGYPGASAIAGLRDGTGGMVFCSRPPRGVEIPRAIRRLQNAMDLAQQRGCVNEMIAVNAWYKRGRRTVADVANDLAIGQTELIQRRRAGEKALLALGVLSESLRSAHEL